MREKLEQRLEELKSEYESGQKMLEDLETRQAELRTTLLRISGAIQVLQEVMDEEARASHDGSEPLLAAREEAPQAE